MSKGRLGILVGGGPAPGLNGVIAAATIEGINQGYEVIGFRDGFKWLAQGEVQYCRPLSIRDVKDIHLRGGSILGTSRTNPTKSEEQMKNIFTVFEKLGITALVSIGGDDTAFSASVVAKRSGGKIKVANVPKTIDNDLPLPGTAPTFGYETARHYGVQIVRNLIEDARTTSRWYLIISMGRAAGHLALGIAKASAATLSHPARHRDCPGMFVRKLWRCSSACVRPRRTQNQITKRTQSDPLFSTRAENESQIPPTEAADSPADGCIRVQPDATRSQILRMLHPLRGGSHASRRTQNQITKQSQFVLSFQQRLDQRSLAAAPPTRHKCNLMQHSQAKSLQPSRRDAVYPKSQSEMASPQVPRQFRFDLPETARTI